VLELASGGDLWSRIQRGGTSEQQAARYGMGVWQCLGDAVVVLDAQLLQQLVPWQLVNSNNPSPPVTPLHAPQLGAAMTSCVQWHRVAPQPL
jgi:hypothetical protein